MDLPNLVLFKLGQTPVTLVSIIAALAVAAAGFLLARIMGRVIARVRSRAANGGASLYIVEKLVSYALIIAGLVAAVNMLGVNLASLAVFAGALGVGVGLGLQGVVKEFVSGLVIIMEGSVQVGDYIELDGGGRGEVKEVGPRATRVRNNDNVDILLPNSKLIEERVTTWTHRGATRRVHIPFSVAYGSDKATVRKAVLEAAQSVPFTTPDTETRKTQVWLTSFGESALNFELLVWPELSAVKRPASVQAAYNWAIEEALCKYGIEMPLPQMDVRLRSLFGREGDEALRAARMEDRKPQPEAHAAGPATNDAVEDLQVAKEQDLVQGPSLGDEPGAEDQDEHGQGRP